MTTDPLKDVRTVRRQISDECDNQPDKVFDFYQSFQERMKQTGRFKFINTRMENVHAAHATEQSDDRER